MIVMDPLYDGNGKITIDRAAADRDREKIRIAIGSLESAKNNLNILMRQAESGQGQTTTAASEKARELVRKIDDLVGRLNETSEFIRRTVVHYEEVDAKLKAQMEASQLGGE